MGVRRGCQWGHRLSRFLGLGVLKRWRHCAATRAANGTGTCAVSLQRVGVLGCDGAQRRIWRDW